MHVLVFAKQIPNVNKIEFDPLTMRIRRDNVELTMNSFDRKAVEEGIRIREKHGGRVSVATMGPPSAAEILKEAIQMGADHGYLITDRIYAGADTLVTSRVLSKFASGLAPDIILAGKYTLDGETSQVPPEVAEMLHFGFKSSISSLEIDGGSAVVEFENEEGIARYRIPIPAVFSVSEKINKARGPGKDAVNLDARITVMGENELQTGSKGSDSPTSVIDTVKIESGRQVNFLQLNEESLKLIDGLVKASPSSASALQVEPFNGESTKELWGVALNDREVAFQIASKISMLSAKAHMRVEMIGNISPGELEGMPCHEYCYIETGENEPFSDTLSEMIEKEAPACVIFPSTVDGREVSGTIAARLGLGLTADCVELDWEDGRLTQHKPAFGGGIIARIVTKTAPQMATVRPGVFRKGMSAAKFGLRKIEAQGRCRNSRLSFEKTPGAFRSITSSAVVIGVGRGVKTRDRMPEVMELAELLGAAVGATRPIVDSGFVPRQQQIGLTGYSISPEVYIALGLSGRDNHVVGIRYAKKVIAVNSSAEAPIFKYADIGIVADMFDFIGRYREYLSAGRKG